MVTETPPIPAKPTGDGQCRWYTDTMASNNPAFRYAELAAFALVGAYRIGHLLAPKDMRRGKARAEAETTHKLVPVILGETPLYRNIGDMAIAVAQEQYLHRIGVDDFDEYVENDRWASLAYYRRVISPDTVIVLQGGGNMGERYFGLDLKRASVIKAFPRNRIVIMPQTTDYNGALGDALLRYMRHVYRQHGDVHLFARERRSYELMKKQFEGVDVQLSTDIVMTYDPQIHMPREQRHGALVILRQDSERVQSVDLSSQVDEVLSAHFDKADIRRSDTIHDEDIEFGPECLDRRRDVVQAKLREFASAELVVTDRLHGMIFSAITGTPCVAFDNANRKISESYNAWFRHLPYIKLTDGNHLASDIDTVLDAQDHGYDFELMRRRCDAIATLVGGDKR